MKYNPTSVYKRIDNILYQDDIAIYKLHLTFPDWNPLTEQGAKYMERFIEMRPTQAQYLLNPCNKIEVRDEIPERRTITVEQITLPEPDMNGEVDYSKSTSKMVEATISVVPIYEVGIKSTIGLGVEGHDPNSSRLDQVRYWMSRGVTSPSIIASTIGANASYVQRLVSQIKQKI